MDVEHIYREESGRILATLIRLLGSFDLAEEVMQEERSPFALEQWPAQGIPDNPRAWLITIAHHKGSGTCSAAGRGSDSKREELQKVAELEQQLSQAEEGIVLQDGVSDDRLRLIFTCCHPALMLEAQVALTLRTLCGLTTEEIARAFPGSHYPPWHSVLCALNRRFGDAQFRTRCRQHRNWGLGSRLSCWWCISSSRGL